MRVVVRCGAGDRELELRVRAGARLSDLAAAAGEAVGPVVAVDGRAHPSDRLLGDAGVAEGCLVELVPPGFVPGPAPAPHEVVAVAGLGAGRSWPLVDRAVVGRGAGADVALEDPQVSRRHCSLAVRAGQLVVTDLGARNAVLVDDRVLRPGEELLVDLGSTVRLGGAQLQVRARPERRPRPSGTARVVHRPPRPPLPPEPSVPDAPALPPERSAEPLGVTALVGPLVLAAVMVAVTGDPRYALFSALSPLLALGTWWEGRRRARRGRRRDRVVHQHALDVWAAELRVGAAAHLARSRARAPDLPHLLATAAGAGVRLWERRPGAEDLLVLRVGSSDQQWPAGPSPAADPSPATAPSPAAAPVLLSCAPVALDLSDGAVVGIAGDRGAVLALARSLLAAAAVTTGPADLAVAVCADADRAADWAWSRWLPHTAVPGGGRRVAADGPASTELLRQAADRPLLVVLDGTLATTGHGVLTRPDVSGIVLADEADALSAACDHVVVVKADGRAELTAVRTGTQVSEVLAAGLSADLAERCARDLARCTDPEQADGATLPGEVRLLPLLGLDGRPGDAGRVLERWRAGGRDPGLRTPLGVTAQGVFTLDLVRHGAHGLVGGTTGSGKSELLRSLVAGLAAHADVEHLTFVLVDYKGGAAFDACARLPHVVGLVTDLDEQLGARALRALEAELHLRERVLRAAGVDSLSAYLALDRPAPLPRLVVVVDEFAGLVAELPGFVRSLVGVAQRGRTLGVHLVLATQRPSGVVDDDIRANTDLRIALRVQDRADSTDVIGVPDAAALGRTTPGRAHVRLGPGEVLLVQTALATGVPPPAEDAPVSVVASRPGPTATGATTGATTGAGSGRVGSALAGGGEPARTELDLLVDAVVAAHRAVGHALPRRPWPEPLPPVLPLSGLWSTGPPGSCAPLALADDPAAQEQRPVGWDPARGGLLLLGARGSGTSTALLATALSLAARLGPRELELYALDAGGGALAPLADLPHTGAVVAAHDRERQVRLVRHLVAELDRRLGDPGDRLRPTTVLLLDDLPALRAGHDDTAGLALVDALVRLHAEGPAVGIGLAVTAARPGGVPLAISGVAAQTWVFALADPSDAGACGLRRDELPGGVPGRAVVLPLRLQVQVGLPEDDAVRQVVERWAGAERRAPPVGVLPTRVAAGTLGPALVGAGAWRLPVGVEEAGLSAAALLLHEGDGALVAGPARSGRSTVLCALAGALAGAGVRVLATGSRPTPLTGCTAVTTWLPAADLAATLEALVVTRPTALLVDDADALDDPAGALAALLRGPGPLLRVLAAGRADGLRSAYGHWTAGLRRSRTGLLLRPQVDLDGDLLGVTLPRRAPVVLSTARGYLVADGEAVLVQAATTG